MMSVSTAIIIIVSSILGKAFFAGSEIALISVDKLRLRHEARKGHRSSKLALEMLKKPEWILGTCLLGTNVFTILGTTVATAFSIQHVGPGGILIAIASMSLLTWIFAEIVPKSVFQQLADNLTPKIVYPIKIFSILLFPVTWIFTKIASFLTFLISGARMDATSPFISKEEIKHLVHMTEKGDVKPSERRMIHRLLSFTETITEDIMVPLIDVIALDASSSVADAAKLITQTKHRRLPVYAERIDKITGILNSFDILDEPPRKKIKPLIRSALYVPGKLSVTDLLEQFQSSGQNMAIIVDEYGGAEGILTIEDILEQVVGNIEDEYDKSRILYTIQKDQSIIVGGRMAIDDLNEKFKVGIPPGDYESVGGYIISVLKHIPHAGETIKLARAMLIVHKASRRSVLEVKLKLMETTDT
jgi:CBS domain containing-hemolysin-like protein